jgi:hypothetical protein
MTAPARAAGRPRNSSAAATSTKTRPALWVLPRPAQGRPLAPFVVLMLGLLVLGLVSLLLLNTWSSQDAFRLHTLTNSQSSLDDQEQALIQQTRSATDPLTLAARAQAAGLVPAGPPVFVKEVKPGHYVIVGTKHAVKGKRMGSLLVIPAPPAPKVTAPAVVAAPATAAAPAAPATAVAVTTAATPATTATGAVTH